MHAGDLMFWMTLAVSVALSFMFSGMEAGVQTLNPLRIRNLVRAGGRRARLLQGFMDHPENFLWSILVGNTVANFLAIGLVVEWLRTIGGSGWQPLWFFLALMPIVFAFYCGCELLPKMLFRLYPHRLCLMLVLPFRFVHLAMGPLVAIVDWFSNLLLVWTGGRRFTGRLFGTREELRQLMLDAAPGLTHEESAMINRVMDLQTLTVGSIAIPLEKAVTITADQPLDAALDLFKHHNLGWLPVWQDVGGSRRIAGVLALRTVMFQAFPKPGPPVRELMSPALFLNEDTRLQEALRRMQRGSQRLAIVTSRDLRDAAIVTLPDLLGVIFGGKVVI